MAKNKASVIGKYVVLSSPTAHDALEEVNENSEIEGTFNTLKEAEQCVRDEGDCFSLDGACEGRNEDWGSSMFICQVLKVRKAVPIVNIKVELTTATPTTGAGEDVSYE